MDGLAGLILVAITISALAYLRLLHTIDRVTKLEGQRTLTTNHRRIRMSFGSWLKSLFHRVTAQHVAGALAASKQTIDQVGAIEKWSWLPEFDTNVNTAISLLDVWKSGQPTSSIEAALGAALDLVDNQTTLSDKDKALIVVFIDTAESGIELLAGN